MDAEVEEAEGTFEERFDVETGENFEEVDSIDGEAESLVEEVDKLCKPAMISL